MGYVPVVSTSLSFWKLGREAGDEEGKLSH
jgi:hypothetical protein